MRKIGLVFALSFLVLTSGCITTVSTGQVGIKHRWGTYDPNELGTGLKLYVPFMEGISKINVKTQDLKEQVTVPSNEGLMVGLDVSVIFHFQGNLAMELFTSVRNPIDDLIRPYLRNLVRDEVAKHTVKAVYGDKREEIAFEVLNKMKENLESRGIIIEDVLLRNVILPEKVTQAIELKLQKEQEALQKEFELESAKKDAEIRVTEAEGIAKAQKIISESLTAPYLQYEFIKALTDKDNNIIYVPTEANLPILEAKR